MRLSLFLALPLGAAAQLNALAKNAGLLYFGTASSGDTSDAPYYALESNSSVFGQWTPENDQKWEVTEPQRHVYSFSRADTIVSRAEANGQIMRCHTLVWHSQLPPWVSGRTWSRRSLTCVIRSHIQNVMGHYKGKCYAWDVVNEALEDDGSYRKSVFYNTLGTDYFAIAFKEAALVDPAAKLYYNDCRLHHLLSIDLGTPN
jgi:endo-1,4-beta-xylanase